MESLSKYPLLLFTFCLLFISSCSTTETSRAEKTSESMETVKSHVDKIANQVDATESSLANITNAEASEIEEAIEKYRENVSKIEELESEFSEEAEKMRSRGNNYFTEWQKETETYDEQQLREASSERREELSDAFEQITDNSGAVSRSLQTYLTDIKEIEDYLDMDPTPEGVAAISSLKEKVEENGQQLKNAIDEMKDSIENAQSQMGSA